MQNADATALRGLNILVVEDEFLVAMTTIAMIQASGGSPVGPHATPADALAALAGAERIDAAVVDLNLGGTMSDDVIRVLVDRGIPMVLATGYDLWSIPDRYRSIVRCQKPFTRVHLLRGLAAAMERAAAA